MVLGFVDEFISTLAIRETEKSRVPPSEADDGESHDTPALPWAMPPKEASCGAESPTSVVSNSVVILPGRGSGLEN